MRTPSIDSDPNGAAPRGVDDRISNWLLKHPDSTEDMTVQATPREEDAGCLADSTYEFVDDDIESRDGNATESVASADYSRPDDVTSLADTENSFDDAGSERSHATGEIPGMINTNQEGDAQAVSQSAESFLETTMETSGHQIIFEEPSDQQIAVKANLHIKNLSADEIKIATPYLKSHGNRVPDQMSASLSQTMMGTRILTTVVPLRILYVGGRGAMHDIIRKIGSAVAAYMDNDSLSGSGSAQFYNVIPVSEFGSRNAPEIELMPSSGWNFQVEECLKARTSRSQDPQAKDSIVELTLDKNTYRSVPQMGGFHVQPKWELPHLSIFYCSENDTPEMRQTRMAASEFTSRHNIARIYITHKPILEKPLEWKIQLGQHPLHLSLHAKYTSGRPKYDAIPARLPVDLASFMSIDARQMNRNLAYITFKSMAEQAESLEASNTHKVIDSHQTTKASPADRAISKKIYGDVKDTNTDKVSQSLIRLRWSNLVPVGILITGVLASIFVNMYNFKPLPANLVSINGNLTPTQPSPVTVITSTTTTESAVVSGGGSYTTRVETRTTTKTVAVAEVRPSSASSVSLVPSKDVGNVAEKFDSHKSVCTAERISDQEVLIRIPSATKLSWLAKEAMLVTVTRNNETVNTERVYSSQEGIVLHFERQEAHGTLQIAVVTTKHPKVNETFHIDLGTSWTRGFHETLDKLCQRVYDDVLPKDFNLDETLARIDDWRNKAVMHAQFLAYIGREQAEVQGARAAEAGRDIAAQAIAVGADMAAQAINAGTGLADRVREPLGAALLKAQVDSRAQWLRMTGRFSEAREYERKASEAGATSGKCSEKRCGWLGRKAKKESAKKRLQDKKETLREKEARREVLKERKAEVKDAKEKYRDALKERKAGRKSCNAKNRECNSKRDKKAGKV